MPPRSPTIVGSAVDTIVWSSDASSSTSRSAPKIRRTRSLRSVVVSMRETLLSELAAARLQALQLAAELTRELVEALLTLPEQLELALDMRDRGLDDAQALRVGRALFPLVAKRGARLFRLD